MKHLSSISLICISLFFLQTILPVDQSNVSEKQKERFDFSKLPDELQNQVVLQAWNNVENHKMFEKDLRKTEKTILTGHPSESNETTKEDREKYKFYGYKEPIYFYTLEKGLPKTLHLHLPLLVIQNPPNSLSMVPMKSNIT